jgi:hypothetical protein
VELSEHQYLHLVHPTEPTTQNAIKPPRQHCLTDALLCG